MSNMHLLQYTLAIEKQQLIVVMRSAESVIEEKWKNKYEMFGRKIFEGEVLGGKMSG